MKLRTEIEIPPFDNKIDYTSRIFTIGSCFAQRIGAMMERVKLPVTINPTGTLFNPMSVCATIERLCERRYITAEELHEGDSGWYHFDFHSSLSAPTLECTLKRINQAIDQGHTKIKEADWVVITLGTSWIYKLRESGELVANCHKLPAREFSRSSLSVDKIAERLDQIVGSYLKGKKVILTVSPIRHIADGLSENSLSKATLRLAIEQVRQNNPQAIYFPAYEALIDDLRDYRFYAQDMVHPSDVAVEYIWDLFCDAALSTSAREIIPRVMKIIKAAEHRPTNPSSEAHKSLCRAQLRAINGIRGVELSKESEYFSEQLKINS